ncbi:hypothetical protein B0T11DRAFT_287729 [Plectosphaerella cucumerina]|uniref:Autophagy-related protein 28 n=1 Tax=Plectosphaerella cucumerina TaxID=40658 RepID=A0A8K0TEH8_9PEZI|nr:hypothetical protein B0T11DRAFT_287729 [Plectosphaerella cucumerina]
MANMPFSRTSAFFDRMSNQSRPLLPLHEKRRNSNDYDLQELPPDVEEALLSENESRKDRLTLRSPSPMDAFEGRPSSAGSSSKQKGRVHFFAGPPPPIARSVMVQDPARSSISPRGGRSVLGSKLDAQPTLGSSFFETPWQKRSSHIPDSIWRSLQRREKNLGRELQDLLDMQASSLVAGSGPTSSVGTSDFDAFSDDGSSTPTATFYSAVSSRSRMTATLDNPPRANARGNVIPIRQPRPQKPRGLRAARSGLTKAISALTDIKYEEDSHLRTAIAERKKALSLIRKLSAKQEGISNELDMLSDESEEPLAKELRDLASQHDALDAQIREMEEKLAGMKNRRRWLGRKMDDVRNRREAGLSGYKGALREVEGELEALVRRPRIEPLDTEALAQDLQDDQSGVTSPTDFMTGEDFLKLIPERRTVDMAVEWWEGELRILEARRKQVNKDREALEGGSELWQRSIKLVSDFEASLRSLMNGGTKGKSKDGTSPPGEIMEAQLSHMEEVIRELDNHLKEAEENNWNLLICAVGAELEAFQEAESVLRRSLGIDATQVLSSQDTEETKEEDKSTRQQSQKSDAEKDDGGDKPGYYPPSESDNEVPSDLLGAHDSHDEQDEPSPSETKKRTPPLFRRESSSNDPPPEFLAEHDPDSESDSRR